MSVITDSPKSRYPWAEWTDGGVKALAVRGEDEMTAMERVKRLRNSIYVHAKRHDYSVRTLVEHGDDHVLLRFQFQSKDAADSDFSDIFSTGTLQGIEVLSLDEAGVPLSA